MFERGAVTLAVGLAGEDGWITGIQLLPPGAAEPVTPWEPPPYADPGRFTQNDVTVGDGLLAVGGALSLPGRSRPLPGVVLLSGSGPQDRDETIGRNKPLKDLAWGLASAGVAVLRFDKVTFAHADRVAADRDFTVTGEYVPHAVAAIQALRELRGYDPAATAAASGRPVLLVQGGRDYQVTVADDLSRWRAALDGRPDVTIRVYEADNHLFFPGSGPPSPADYEPAQHVDPEVVAGVADWITARGPAVSHGPAKRSARAPAIAAPHKQHATETERAGQP